MRHTRIERLAARSPELPVVPVAARSPAEIPTLEIVLEDRTAFAGPPDRIDRPELIAGQREEIVHDVVSADDVPVRLAISGRVGGVGEIVQPEIEPGVVGVEVPDRGGGVVPLHRCPVDAVVVDRIGTSAIILGSQPFHPDLSLRRLEGIEGGGDLRRPRGTVGGGIGVVGGIAPG